MEQDRLNQIKANSVHVDENFNTLLNAVNRKLEIDGSIVPTADLPMGSHKITGLATPTLSADAATKGYTDSALALKANLASPTFTGTPKAPTPSTTDNSTTVATTAFMVNVLQTLYPVGAVYIGTQVSCPLATLIPGSTWEQIEGRYLLASGTIAGSLEVAGAGSYVSAGLPDINGTVGQVDFSGARSFTGAFYEVSSPAGNTGATHAGGTRTTFGIAAHLASSIYGNSTTVRPAAYAVNVWHRTA
jgi:hypothetical protein